MSECAWCGASTGELLVPGARGAFVHPSCEASRRGRRWFLGALGLGAAAVYAAPLLELVPEETVPVYSAVTGEIVGSMVVSALLKEKYREIIPELFERSATFYARLKTAHGYAMERDQAEGRALRDRSLLVGYPMSAKQAERAVRPLALGPRDDENI